MCLEYLAGVAEMMTLTGHMFDDTKDPDNRRVVGVYAACYEHGYTMDAVLQAFLNWVDKHPERMPAP
jgi:hypothetical protein